MKGKYHIDLFGTMLRFFPMFDFPNNPTNIVYSIDVDLHDEDYPRFEILLSLKPKGLTGSGSFNDFIAHDSIPHFFAGTFMYNMQKTENSMIIDFIKNAHKIESKGKYGKRLTTFGYGIDEIFLNDYLVKKQKNASIIVEYQPSYFIFHSNDRIMEQKNREVSSKILSMILGKYGKNMTTLEDKIKFVDKNFYNVTEKNDINNELSKRFSYVIEYLVKHNKAWLNMNAQKIINGFMKHIISCVIIANIDIKGDKCNLKKIDLHNVVYDDSTNDDDERKSHHNQIKSIDTETLNYSDDNESNDITTILDTTEMDSDNEPFVISDA
jgi:curved DNA-binding protein CbpA